MAPPKGPPKSSSGPAFALVVISVSLLLLLLWGWQSGWLTKAGTFVQNLVAPARYEGELPASDLAGHGQGAGHDGAGHAGGHVAGTDRDASGDETVGQPEALDASAVVDATGMQLAEPEPLLPLDPLFADEPPQTGARAAQRRPASNPGADDRVLINEIGQHWPLTEVQRFFNLQEPARRLVITVDQLSRWYVPSQMRVMRGTPGLLQVKREDGVLTLDPANYRRYEGFVQFVESLDAKTLARVYRKFYPLLQHSFEETGFPDVRFHQRVVAAIDDLLAARQPDEPVRLVQPKVLYRFADPELEALSAGQKIMIRVGPERSERLKKVLRRLRAELVRQPPAR